MLDKNQHRYNRKQPWVRSTTPPNADISVSEQRERVGWMDLLSDFLIL
jgi:hypothetical protein